ncbi:MAG: error-prone DNA polymerase [Acidimicrobiia bacterium]|nr:error-prone DNA polymerase [Acidimicrobiia bacterium]
MGWRNPPVPWGELERRLSDRLVDDPLSSAGGGATDRTGRASWPVPGDGGDSPAWSRRRGEYTAPELQRRRSATPYAELHCHSNFSFLDGASHPEELVAQAVRCGLEALALTDHNGFYGVVRFAEAARAHGLPTVFGAELTLGGGRRADATGAPGGPPGEHVVVLARDPRGYALLARAISEAQLRGEKSAPQATLDDLVAIGGTAAPPADQDRWLVLTGCRKGAVPAAVEQRGPSAAATALAHLTAGFGRANVAVELWDHGHPLDSARNDALAEVAISAGVDLVATNNVHYATADRRRLATALAAVRARTSLDELDGWLPAASAAQLRTGDEQARRFARWPGVVERAAELGLACAFDLSLVAPSLPPFPCPDGLDEMGYLRHLTDEGATRRYGARHDPAAAAAWAQIDHELGVIEQLGFAGYFLVVADIVAFCVRHDIYCQGRGSAANSAVCYALGITKADAVGLGLLFERFLSPERDGPPDIDLDIESGRREEVIQYVYERHGRHHAAQVANVVTYRARSAIRDMARALGYSSGQQDAWARAIDRWQPVPDPTPTAGARRATEDIPPLVVDLAHQVEHFPRHLGIHSGGMVMCDRPVIEVCPVERATMADRTVLQWDKDDCAAAGLVKFDLLGLGMLTALHLAVDLVAEAHDTRIDLAELPQEEAVYDMLCAADSVGVFQVESRAQMATLPRLRPRCFYDLVVEVALIRPGPIQGGSVHPYIRRRNSQEPVTYLHPLLEPSLSKTLGIPLFQEQLMQMAIDVAGFTAAEADQLRQAMGSKRSSERMERLRRRFYEGMAERGVVGAVADQIWDKLAAFANFGFPESHSVSFAYLVYASSWIKLRYPAAFCAALLNAQPMGFYSPDSLVADARRHGVEVRTPDLNASGVDATLVWPADPATATGRQVVRDAAALVGEVFDGALDEAPDGSCVVERDHTRRRHPSSAPPFDQAGEPNRAEPVAVVGPQPTVLLGLSSVRHLSSDMAERLVAERQARGPFTSMEDLRRRLPVPLDALEALATAGAFGGLRDHAGQPLDRRRALWAAGAVAQTGPERLEGVVTGAEAPRLVPMTDQESALADLWATGVAPGGHPLQFLRDELSQQGIVTAADLRKLPGGRKVRVAGVVTHRQRPATAGGTTFLNLEDETGFVNVVCSLGCWEHHRSVVRTAAALVVRGRLESSEGVVNVVAERISPLGIEATVRSRDFR